mgnify:FL=1
MKNIAILGAGWLGTSLAHSLSKENNLKVSVRSEEKKQRLQNEGLQVEIVAIKEDTIVDDSLFFSNTELLIVSLTPIALPYFEQVILAIEQNHIKKVILFSSTGIYTDCKGWVTETSDLHLEIPKVKHLKTIEDLFLLNENFDCTVLRFGGLMGKDRHPVKFLAKKEIIEEGNEPVNMISDEEIISIMEQIITKELPNDVFNVVTNDHRTKKDFYTEAALERGLQLPPFTETPNRKNRKVDATKIQQFLSNKNELIS